MAEPLRYRRPHSDSPPDARTRQRLITPSLTDELGERHFTVDTSSETLLETLQFRRDFGDNPAFEVALRERVDATRYLRHASLATVAAVERDDTALCLISKLPSGRRLSELPAAGNGWASALKTVRELLPALLVLHQSGVSHGALSTRRVIVTRDGRLVLVEHVLASAIESLNLTPAGLRALDIVIDDGHEPVRFTEQTDLAQMGFLALSLLMGRPLPAEDFPARVPALLDEFVHGVGMPAAAARIRAWLERAMRIAHAEPFASSQDAETAFEALSHDVSVRVAESAGALLAFESEAGAPEDTRREPEPAVVVDKRTPPAAKPAADISNARAAAVAPAAKTVPPAEAATHSAGAIARPARTSRLLMWMIAGLAILAIGEGAVLLKLLYARPAGATAPSSAAAPAASPATTLELQPGETPTSTTALSSAPALAPRPLVTPIAPAVTPTPHATSTPAARPVTTPAAKSTRTPTPGPTATPAAPAFGALTVTSPIELQVFKDGALLGSTAASMALADGRHSLTFVNAALGFRVTLPATITGGQMTTLKVPVPNGRVSINAVPWADVTIDGRAVGQTPLANLSLPIGTHEVVFAHPQFGEKRQTVVVTADGIARVTQNYR